jgi:hypothetical protein
MRCIAMPETSIVGAPAVGIRLRSQLVVSEKTWIARATACSTVKQAFSASVMRSTSAQASTPPATGNTIPSPVSSTSAVVRPRSSETAARLAPAARAVSSGRAWKWERTTRSVIESTPLGARAPR